MSGDYFPDKDLQAIGLAAWEAELENELLRDLVIRARALLAESTNWVEWDPGWRWHGALEQFLADSAPFAGGEAP